MSKCDVYETISCGTSKQLTLQTGAVRNYGTDPSGRNFVDNQLGNSLAEKKNDYSDAGCYQLNGSSVNLAGGRKASACNDSIYDSADDTITTRTGAASQQSTAAQSTSYGKTHGGEAGESSSGVGSTAACAKPGSKNPASKLKQWVGRRLPKREETLRTMASLEIGGDVEQRLPQGHGPNRLASTGNEKEESRTAAPGAHDDVVFINRNRSDGGIESANGSALQGGAVHGNGSSHDIISLSSTYGNDVENSADDIAVLFDDERRKQSVQCSVYSNASFIDDVVYYEHEDGDSGAGESFYDTAEADTEDLDVAAGYNWQQASTIGQCDGISMPTSKMQPGSHSPADTSICNDTSDGLGQYASAVGLTATADSSERRLQSVVGHEYDALYSRTDCTDANQSHRNNGQGGRGQNYDGQGGRRQNDDGQGGRRQSTSSQQDSHLTPADLCKPQAHSMGSRTGRCSLGSVENQYTDSSPSAPGYYDALAGKRLAPRRQAVRHHSSSSITKNNA